MYHDHYRTRERELRLGPDDEGEYRKVIIARRAFMLNCIVSDWLALPFVLKSLR